MTQGRELLKWGVCRCALACAAAALCWVSLGALAIARTGAGNDGAYLSATQQANMMLRLRSFAAGATARLEIKPTAGGGRVRLTATNLPPPSALAPTARVYLVWAVGGRSLRLGELRRAARGRAALEFAHPAAFERYSLIVTAEPSAGADHPGGTPVFSTRANEVAALFPGPAPAAAPAHPDVRPRYAARGENAASFYSGIDEALVREAGARDLTLVGVRRPTRRARGYARVAAADGTAYVRASFRRVPPPARFGASRYVLWATTPAGRSHYLGSLPRHGLNRTDTYVRAAGVDAEQFDLLITAERGRRVVGTRRVLATVRPQRVYRGRRVRR